MIKLENDLNFLLGCDIIRARNILSKIDVQIRYCKKHGYETDSTKNVLLDFLNKLSANKYDKSKDGSFIKDGIMYLCDLCDL
jgi:hypothetical protein